MQINNNLHLGQIFTPFESVGKSLAIDKTASDFDNANQKVKKIKDSLIRENMMLISLVTYQEPSIWFFREC